MRAAMQQDASVSGTGNVVVQIVGDGNTVAPGHPHLTLTRYLARRQIRTDLDRLSPYTRSVPLIGREREMAGLWAFLGDPRPLSARVLIGGAGSGKTRLALELCEQAHAKDWSAGFVGRHELKRFFAQQNLSVWGWNRPTLMVVDYAAEHAELLGQWLDELADRLVSDGTPPLRLLLLERHASTEAGWWTTVFASGGYGASNKRALLDPQEPLPVQPLAQGDDRLALLKEVLKDISGNAGGSALNDEELGKRLMEQEWGGDPLVLMMAALQASRVGVQVLSLGRLDLAYDLAGRECDRLQQLAIARSLDPILVRHLAACVTLAQGLGRSEFEDFADREKVLIHRSNGGDAARLADLLQEALSRPEGIAPVLPDLIGEALVLRVLHRKSDTAAVLRCHEAFGRPVAEWLVRCAQDFAVQKPAPLKWLDAIAEFVNDDFEVLTVLDVSLPVSSVVLRNFRLKVAQRLYDLQSAREDVLTHDRARVLVSFANALSSVDRHQAAVEIAKEAVELYRDLVELNFGEFIADLNASLNNLAIMCTKTGHGERALQAAQEAVAVCRKLTANRPDCIWPNLVASLNTLAKALSDLGRHEAGLQAMDEAVDLCRELVARKGVAFHPALAMSLKNRAAVLSDLSKHELASQAAQEAINLYRYLASQQPDVLQPSFAGMLFGFAGTLEELKQYEKSLEAMREASSLYRQLAFQQPDEFLIHLAGTLSCISRLLFDLEQVDEVVQPAQEAIDVFCRIAAAGYDAYVSYLAVSLNDLAAVLGEVGECELALRAAQESVRLYRKLVEQDAVTFKPKLARSLHNLANVLGDIGEHESALQAAQEAVDVRKELVGYKSEEFIPDLASSLFNLVLRLCVLSDHGYALQVAQEVVEIYRKLFENDQNLYRLDLIKSIVMLALQVKEVYSPHDALVFAKEAVVVLKGEFLRQPEVYVDIMRLVLNVYLDLCAFSECRPDEELIGCVLLYFNQER